MNEPWENFSPSWLQTAAPSGATGGLLDSLTRPAAEPWNDPRSTIFAQTPWGSMMPPPSLFGLSPTFPPAPPPSSWASSGASLWHTPFGANAGFSAPPARPVLEPWNDPRSAIFAQTPWVPPPNLFGLPPAFPSAPPPSSWETSVPSWRQSTMPLGANIGYPATSAQPVDESWTDRWAGRTGTTAWPEPLKLPEKSFADRVRENWENPPKGLSWFALARGLYDAARFPFDLADGAYGYRPETPGVWTEEDEFRKNDLRRRLIERSFDFAGLGATGSVPTMLGAKAPRSTLGVFVGPFGAERLTQGGLHPAVNPAKALTDLGAQAMLKARQQAGDLRDGDVFSRSAWFRGADGVVKKELPDTGATLVPTGRVNRRGEEFIWQHPAGDIHQAYNIPPITIGRGVERDFGRGATTNLDTGHIYIAVDPRKPGELAKANRVVVEEIQHAIQAKERFAVGAHPEHEVLFPEYWKALNRPFPTGPEAPQIIREHMELVRRGLSNAAETGTPEYKAAIATYKRVAGEVEGKNALRRLETGYSQHPHETASVPPTGQIVRTPDLQEKTILDAIRRRLFDPPWR